MQLKSPSEVLELEKSRPSYGSFSSDLGLGGSGSGFNYGLGTRITVCRVQDIGFSVLNPLFDLACKGFLSRSRYGKKIAEVR